MTPETTPLEVYWWNMHSHLLEAITDVDHTALRETIRTRYEPFTSPAPPINPIKMRVRQGQTPYMGYAYAIWLQQYPGFDILLLFRDFAALYDFGTMPWRYSA